MSESKSSEKRTITVRNINDKVYKKFLLSMQQKNLNLGDAFSKLMESYLLSNSVEFETLSFENFKIEEELENILIDNKTEITINSQKLMDSNSKIMFTRCNGLIFDKDITTAIFRKFISKIMNCKNIKIPAHIPELIRLSIIDKSENIILI